MKKKYLFLSGLLSALLLVGVSPVQAAPEVYQTKQEAEAALKLMPRKSTKIHCAMASA